MTGITRYTRADNIWTGMVRVGILKTDRGMTVTAFSVGNRVSAGWGVGGSGSHTCGNSTIVATGTGPRYIRMIKAAVWFQVQKMAGIVAGIAFSLRWRMRYRFTDSHNTVMTFAAISKNFLMIDKGGKGKAQRGMTGLAHITGSEVIRQFR